MQVLSDITALSQDSRAAGTKFGAEMTKFVKEKFEDSSSFVVVKQDFKFARYVPDKFALTVNGEEYDCRPALCSANTPIRGLSGNICSYGKTNNISARIVLVPIRKRHESLLVEELAERGAAAAIVYQEKSPLLAARVRYKKSSMPCVCVSGRIGTQLHRKGNDGIRAHIVVRSSLVEAMGTNIIATPKKAISKLAFNAHRDSRIFSCGAVDNASGTSLLLFMARRRNPHFSLISTDAEEYGLLGAKELVRAGGLNDIASEKEVMNIDSIGEGPLHLVTKSRGGSLSARLNNDICRVANQELNLRLGKLRTPRGSDSDVFSEGGFESSWLRSYPTPFATTVEDRSNKMSPSVLNDSCRLLTAIAEAKRV